MSEDFSLERYKEIILLAKEKRYWFPKVCEVGRPPLTKRKFLLIRHDIDVSVMAATEMAQLEYQLGVTTSYYVRLHCPFYNPLEEGTFKKILSIQNMGHEIGLHYETEFFKNIEIDPIRGIYNDIHTLEGLLGKRLLSISQHNPSVSNIYPKLWKDYIDAYQPMLVRDIPYFGDSGRCWREGCIITKIGKFNQIHTLIHPYSWTRWHKHWEDNLRAHGEAFKAKIDCDIERDIIRLKDYLAKRDELDRKRANKYLSLNTMSV